MWVTGTGAFLLLAAAAVFVAVRWDHLDDHVKLGILGALTGGFLLAGRRLRRVLPATGGVLFHLGALLIPMNTATVALHADLPWGKVLLVEGLTATLAWFVLDRVEPSPVLRWGAGLAFVVAAAGGASVIGVPTPIVLAVAALVAQRLRAPRPALGWALAAGIGPVLVFAEPWVARSQPVEALGLTPDVPGIVWALSGALAAIVIGTEAHRRREVVLVVPAAASLTIGVAATWTVFAPSAELDVLGLAAVFLLAETVARLVRRDPFWDVPAQVAATVLEVLAAVATPGLILATAWWFVDGTVLEPRRTEVALGALLAAAAWLVGDLRRLSATPDRRRLGWSLAIGSGWWPATFGIVAGVLVGVALLTGSSVTVGLAMVGLAALLVLTGRPGGHAVAAVLAILAPLLASFDLVTSDVYQRNLERFAPDTIQPLPLSHLPILAIGLAGALVLAGAAVVRARMADPVDNRLIAWFLAVAALGPIALATFVLADHTPNLPLLLAASAAAWMVAVVLDRARTGSRTIEVLGAVGRLGALLSLLGAGLIGSHGTAILAGVLAVACVVDAVRIRSEIPLLGLSIALPVLVAAVGIDLGLTVPETGLALTLLAAVAAGGHLLLGERRGWPLIGVVVAGGSAGFGLAATESTTGWLAVLVLAGVGLAYATVHHSIEGAAISAVAAVAATWGLLADGGVEVYDAYLAPVAALLVVAGTLARRSNGVSSWVAYGPAIVLLGGSALFERVDGGSGVHALVVGLVAGLAVIAGGALRLAAPLLLGTALLVALTLHESLSVTRQVPTWGWLALGGTVLVAAGIVMERRDTNPVETGRRLVDVVGTRFR